MKKSV
jgi:hypothetical protein